MNRFSLSLQYSNNSDLPAAENSLFADRKFQIIGADAPARMHRRANQFICLRGSPIADGERCDEGGLTASTPMTFLMKWERRNREIPADRLLKPEDPEAGS